MKGMIVMAITVEKTIYEPWGNCIRISNGTVEAFATVDFGPRIIRLGVIGKANMFFEDFDDNINRDLSGTPFEGDMWHIYGGHRLWVSPEDFPQCYFPDNQPVDYELLSNGVVLKQVPQNYTNLALEIKVTMADDGTVTAEHKVTNIGAWPVKLAPWCLSVLAPGGVEIVPQPDRETGLLANRVFSIWPYTDMSDKRVTWGKDYIILRQDTTVSDPFKFGINSEKGYAMYFLDGCLLIKKFAHIMDAEYPDYGVSFETYTNNVMLEMESLGTLREMEPGTSAYHTETWNIFDNVALPELTQEDIDITVKKYI